MLDAIKKADWLIHVGDYTSQNIFNKLIQLKGERFKGVPGNADPLFIRNYFPSKSILEIGGKKIGFTHPISGGPIEKTLKKVFFNFRNDDVDIIIYGHTHEATIIEKNDILIINPGKGYYENTSFGPPTTFVILKLDNELKPKLIKINHKS